MDTDPARTLLKMGQCIKIATDAHVKVANSLLSGSNTFASITDSTVYYMVAIVYSVHLREILQAQGGAHFLKIGVPPSYANQMLQSAVKRELLQELQPYQERFGSIFGVKPKPVSWTDRIAHVISGRAL